MILSARPIWAPIPPQVTDGDYGEDQYKFIQGIQQVTTRLVRVIIMDPNPNLPLDSRIMFDGDEKLTDSSDQELFFELPMSDMLVKHNDMRSKTINKVESSKFGKDVFLEPARIRDLKMVVVNVVQF